MQSPVTRLLQSSARPCVFLLGDVMLDHYLWGDVERISPEAPIPILRVNREEHRLGGAGSVAAMLSALDAVVVLASVVGDDPQADQIRAMIDRLGIDRTHVVVDPSRRTTRKQRLLGGSWQRGPHHMMRVDWEDTHALDPRIGDGLIEVLRANLSGAGGATDGAHCDLVLVSDYAKGVCSDPLIAETIQAARASDIPVVIDPVRGVDYRRYAGATCITPNRVEASQATGISVREPGDGLAAAEALVQLGIDSVAVTMDCDGIAWCDARGNRRHFPCRPRQVADVTGAGDMVLAVIGLSLALGADFHTAIELANLAGGLEVGQLGVVPFSRLDLLREAQTQSQPGAGADSLSPRRKIVRLSQLLPELSRRRMSGQQIVMTNGCFDLLHPGHVASLAEARRHGDCLVVGLNSDRSVARLKGPGRPVVDEQGRAAMLAALETVDYVVIFDEISVQSLVERIRPDVLIKAAQYGKEQVVGWQVVERHGGRVVTVPMAGEYSTTRLIERSHVAYDRHRRAS